MVRFHISDSNVYTVAAELKTNDMKRNRLHAISRSVLTLLKEHWSTVAVTPDKNTLVVDRFKASLEL